MTIYFEGKKLSKNDIDKLVARNYQVYSTFVVNRKMVKTELRRLPSGYWAVFIDDTWMDASSPTREAAQAKLNEFLKKIKGACK